LKQVGDLRAETACQVGGRGTNVEKSVGVIRESTGQNDPKAVESSEDEDGSRGTRQKSGRQEQIWHDMVALSA